MTIWPQKCGSNPGNKFPANLNMKGISLFFTHLVEAIEAKVNCPRVQKQVRFKLIICMHM